MSAIPQIGELLYEGKAKKVYTTDDPQLLLVKFKDDATAFNGAKRGQIADKGVINAKISTRLFELLEEHGIATHFHQQVDDRTLLVDRLEMVALEVVVRNRVTGSLQKRTGMAEGIALSTPIVEFYFKNDALGDPLLNDDHIFALGLATADTLALLRARARAINEVLLEYFEARDVLLVDFKLEFGTARGSLRLGDEISPDTCRFWDKQTLNKLDKDRFRQDLGDVEAAYQEMLHRVMR